MADRDRFIRETQRRTWARRTDDYAPVAAGHSAHTEALVARVDPQPGERVLDVGTGTGAVAVAAARSVGPTGFVVATDLVPEWGDQVAATCAEAGVTNVEFRAMGAETLDLPDESFDVALSQFALMFVPRPLVGLREMRRVLRDGGRLGIAVWSTVDKVEHHAVGRRVTSAYIPPLPPDERMPTPMELGEPGLIERLIAEAGFRQIVVSRQTLETSYESAEAYWRHQLFSDRARAILQQMSSSTMEQMRAEMEAALAGHRRDGQVYFMSEAIFVTGVR
jgi:ubiquinone/menaquinone biosynthesis C-methylase UbiE